MDTKYERATTTRGEFADVYEQPQADEYDWTDDEDPAWESERNGGYVVPVPPPRSTPKRSDDESSAYRWDHERFGVYVRISKLMLRDESLNTNDLAVFFELAEDEKGTLVAWPSSDELSERTGLTRKVVRTCIHHLIKGGWLDVWPWMDSKGFWDSDTYVLYPRCAEKYAVAELSAVRQGGRPDPNRPKNHGLDRETLPANDRTA